MLCCRLTFLWYSVQTCPMILPNARALLPYIHQISFSGTANHAVGCRLQIYGIVLLSKCHKLELWLLISPHETYMQCFHLNSYAPILDSQSLNQVMPSASNGQLQNPNFCSMQEKNTIVLLRIHYQGHLFHETRVIESDHVYMS